MNIKKPLPNPFEQNKQHNRGLTADNNEAGLEKPTLVESGAMNPPIFPLPPVPRHQERMYSESVTKTRLTGDLTEEDLLEQNASELLEQENVNSEYDLDDDYEEISPEADDYLARLFVGSSDPVAQQSLYALAQDIDWQVRNSIAMNPNTPDALLDILAADENDMVRQTILENPNTSDTTFAQFANDEDEDILIAFIESDRSTPFLLSSLYSTDNEFVADALIDSEIVPDDVKSKLQERFL